MVHVHLIGEALVHLLLRRGAEVAEVVEALLALDLALLVAKHLLLRAFSAHWLAAAHALFLPLDPLLL